jgi:DNA-binding transcriptional regulator GbsR (MarR family)
MLDLAVKSIPSEARNGHELAGLERELVDHFIVLAGAIGIPRSYGEIYGILYAASEPLSFTDIQERTDLSKGSISTGLNALRSVGAIRPSSGPGRHREHYLPELELRQLIAGLLGDRLQSQLKDGAARVDRMFSRHRTARLKNGHSKVLASRLEKLQSWHRKAGSLVPLISKFLG